MCIESTKIVHPIKNKEENKEKNKPAPAKSDTAPAPEKSDTAPAPAPEKSDTTTTGPVKTTATKLSVFIERYNFGGGDDCLKTKPKLGGGNAGNYDSTFKWYGLAGYASSSIMGGVSHA